MLILENTAYVVCIICIAHVVCVIYIACITSLISPFPLGVLVGLHCPQPHLQKINFIFIKFIFYFFRPGNN